LRLTEASSLKLSVGFSRGQTKQVRTADLPAVAPDSAADPAAEGVSGDTRRAEAESEPESVSGSVALTTQLRRDLAHKIGFSRGIRGGFSSAFETYDRYSYHLRWGGDATTAEAYTEYTDVENSDLDSDYTSWVSGLILSYPLVENIRLRLSTAYNIRENSGDVLEDADPQDVNNYETWTTRLSSSFELTKKIDFTTYFQHVERTSDDDQLAYKRDIVAANLRFSHQF